MSEADVRQTRTGGGGVNPSFTATGIFPSGLDASGPVDMASAFAASGLESSALIKGTIGQFLATALAGSGFNASGPTLLTTVSAQDIVTSTLTTCAHASFGGSVNFTSAFSALDIEVSTINGSPPGTTTSTFTSGITTCALASIGASLIVDGSAAFLALASFNASATFTSGANYSGPLTASTASILNVGTSTLTACTLLSAGGSVIFTSGANLSGQITASSASILTVGTSTLTACALLSAGGSAIFTSGINLSGTATTVSVLMACTLAVSGIASFGGSAAFASGLNTSGQTVLASPSTTVPLVILVPTGQNVANTTISAGTLLFQIDASGNVTAGGRFSAVGSVLVACTLAVSGLASFGGSVVLASGINISGGTTAVSVLVACTLAVSGLTSIGASMIVDGVASFQTSAIFQSGLNASGPTQVTTGIFTGGIAGSGAGTLNILANVSAPVASVFIGCALLVCGPVAIPAPSTAQSAGGLAYLSLGVPTGAQASYWIQASAGNNPEWNINLSGLMSMPNITASTVTASTLASLANIIASTETNTTLLSLGGSLAIASGTNTSANIVMTPPSTFASAGSALISIGFASGAQTSYIMFVSVGSAGQVFALTTSGVLSTNAVNALSITVSTINGSPPGGTTSTFTSGLTTCALMSVGASMIIDGTASFGASTIFESGINSSGTDNQTSILLACTLAVSGLASFGASAKFASGLNTSGAINLALPSTLNADFIQISVPTGGGGGTYAIRFRLGGADSWYVTTAGNMVTQGLNVAGTMSANGPTHLAGLNSIAAILTFSTIGAQSGMAASGVINAQAGIQYTPFVASVSTTLTATTLAILVNTSIGGSNVTLTLPSAATVSGAYMLAIKIDAAANSMLIATKTGDTIEGASLIGSTATAQYSKAELYSGGSATWYVTASGII